jgi:hypothetical protein
MNPQESIPEKIKKYKAYIQAMKSAQKISGDSWVLYRYQGTWDTSGGTFRYLVFRTFNTKMQATVKLAEDLGFSIYPIPVRSQNGVYFWLLQPYYTNYGFILNSTMPGTWSVEDSPPF